MAIRFAKQAGNWSSASTWDGGLTIPGVGDDVYSNGFTVTLDQDINVGCLNGGTTPVGVPLSPIPDMTSNTSPSGVGQAFASSNNANAWLAFKKPIINFTNTGWQGSVVVPQQLGYQFDTPKNIQRYSWYNNSGTNQRPRNWTFEGSNDGVSWVTLHTVTAYTNTSTYFSPVISNPSSYIYYRINVSAVQIGTTLYIDYLDMTESTDAISNGYGTNGQFNSSTNRTITCTGFGIIRPSFGTNLVLNIIGSSTTTNITGNIVQYYNDNTTRTGIISVGGGNNTVNISGNVFIDSTATQARGRCFQNSIASNTINIVGDVYNYSVNGTDVLVILNDGGNPLNITGNIINYGTSGTINRVIQTTGITTITGNIIGPTGGVSYCITGTSTVNPVRIIGNIVCSNSYWPLNTPRLSISPSVNMSIRFQDTNNANRFLYTSAQSTGQAAESDVRLGIIYGPNNDYTGTCAVPPSGSVTLGVPVDNTTGTAYTDPTALAAAFFTEISGSSDPLAQRMRNQATVQTTGDQIAALM